MHVAAHVFVRSVLNCFMAGKHASGVCVKLAFVGVQSGLAVDILGYDLFNSSLIGNRDMECANAATALDKRNSYVQVSVYSLTRAESLAKIRAAEEAMCASAAFTCTPMGEPLATYEPDTKLYGAIQRFSIWAAR